MKIIKYLVLLAMLLALSTLSLRFLMQIFLVDYDAVTEVSWITDGDTFDVSDGTTIRLGDVDCPEMGSYAGEAAKNVLSQLIQGRTIYLDIDDRSRYGTYGRLICVVYVQYNQTHLLNVNRAMVEYGYAWIDDYDTNEWNPYTWSLYVPMLSGFSMNTLILYSVIPSLIIVVIVNYVSSKVWESARTSYNHLRS